MDGVFRGKRTGEMGAGALVGEDPEIELLEETGEIGEGGVEVGDGEGADPEIGANLDGILAQEMMGVLVVVLMVMELNGTGGNRTATVAGKGGEIEGGDSDEKAGKVAATVVCKGWEEHPLFLELN